jgi:hypothetical protein
MKYLSLPHLAQYYDIHPDTLRRRLKEIDIIKDEHFVMLGKTVRFDIEKIHPILTHADESIDISSLLNRFLI